MLKTRAALVSVVLLLSAACTKQVPQNESTPLVVQVPPGDEALARALADSLWSGYAAPVDTIALSPEGTLRVVLRPGALIGDPRVENGECRSDPTPLMAHARVGRAAWRVYGEAHGGSVVEVISKEVPFSVKYQGRRINCGRGSAKVLYRPGIWPPIPE
jgi:hypothetical protein